ncbi:MHYT domain-containing protein [Thalassotalea sp. PLHSN55]|uniref:MHYT domain-containing protein n=1 Tax=Thalassotalea sp. PLHSN55 TaxID=3435888 RepID=UPI003F8440B6
MSSSFDPVIVFLSFLVAVYVSYIVVGVCMRIAVSRKKIALYWNIGGALAMAIGIWAMHFIGMLAFTLPIPIYYDLSLTALSIIPAIFSSAIALFMVRFKRSNSSLTIAAILMGLGIAAMHYIGMAAMGMSPNISYAADIVLLSVFIAISASGIALFLLFHQIDNNQLTHNFKILTALIMGSAIVGMHYVGMAAASFSMDCISSPQGSINLDRDTLLIVVTLLSLFILTMTQFFMFLDKKLSENAFYHAVFSAQSSVGKGLLVLENEKVTLINDELEKIFNVKMAANLEVQDLYCAFLAEEYERFYLWITSTGKRTKTVSVNEFQFSVNQKNRTLSMAITGFVQADCVRRLIITDDITEKKQAEIDLKQLNESLEYRVEARTKELTKTNEQLKHSMKALQAAQSELVHSQKMASLGSLVAGISHEINTPIGIGVTCATNIEEQVHTIVNKYQNSTMKKSDLESFFTHTEEGCQILAQNLRRASELISSFKQVAVDQTDDSTREINLKEYLDEIIISMRPKLKRTKIKVDNNIAGDINLITAPGVLYQIISNFIDNSLLHGFEQGAEGVITIACEALENDIKITYTDNGRGVTDEVKAKIFDPFFTTRRGKGGTGLGLNIVYNLITSTLKGKVEIISPEQGGLGFDILLPIAHGDKKNDRN